MKILRAILIAILLVIVLAVAGVWALLFTQAGRDFVVAKVNGYTAGLSTPVVVGRVQGNVLRDARLSAVTVADREGVWLSLEGIRLVWHPLALWHGVAPFELLEVARIEVSRLPVVVVEKTVEVADEQGAVNPLDYMVYVPRNVRLEDVVVGAPVTGQVHRLRAEIASLGAVQEVSVSTLEGPVTAVSGTVMVGGLEEGAVDLGLREAPQGLLGGLLKLPKGAGLEAKVVGGLKDGVFSLQNLEARAGQTQVSAQGEGVKDGSKVAGTAKVTAADLSEWKGLVGDIKGAFYGDAVVSGSLAKLGFGVVVSRSDVIFGGQRLAGLGMKVNGVVDAVDVAHAFVVRGALAGALSGVGEGSYPLTVGLDVNGTAAALGGTVSASMVRKGEQARIVVSGAGVVSPMTGNAMVSGSWVKGNGRFDLAGGVAVDPVRAVLNGLRLVGPGTVVSGSGVVDLQTMLMTGNAVVKVQDLKPLGALAGMDLKGGIDATVAASAPKGVQVGEVNVGRFDVVYGDYTARLKQASRLVWDGKTGSLSPFELAIAGGSVVAQGQMNAETVAGDLVVKNVDIAQLTLNDGVTGKVNLNAKIGGRSAAPVIALTGDVVGETGGYPVRVKMSGNWRDGILGVVADGSSDAAKVRADVKVGADLSLVPFAAQLGADSSLRGTVTADVPLKMFNNLLWASRQQVGGRLSGSGTLSGTLGAPDVGGKFVLADGSYTQSTVGICLKNVGAEIVGNRDKIMIQNLKSTDGLGGSMSGAGSMGLMGERALGANIKLNHLQLFCGGLATGTIDGDVAAKGTLADHTLSGNLLVGPLNVQVPGANGNADIPQVETIRVKAGAKADAELKTITRLALTVNAPQHIYVRGRGLEGEFGGKVEVGGTANAPVLNGGLKAIRGKYMLLDRTLQLGDTSVQFVGPIPPSPYLDIKATTTVQGTEITLAVTGSATKPKLALSSNPSLPQDEVLALLLFGRKLANISAFEALKLAQATRVLAGLDGGEPGILDKARQTLGVDTLDIGSGDTSGDVTVTTGKYLTDKIYLSVQQGTEPADRQVKTEIELTPSVTGNTTVDGTGNQSFGIEWKRNY